jgi:hypothetical protein
MTEELQRLKLRELELKARGFDIQQEQEALTTRVNQLQAEKVKITQDLKEIYKSAEQFQAEIKEKNMIASGKIDKDLGTVVVDKDPNKPSVKPKPKSTKRSVKKKNIDKTEHKL